MKLCRLINITIQSIKLSGILMEIGCCPVQKINLLNCLTLEIIKTKLIHGKILKKLPLFLGILFIKLYFVLPMLKLI